MRNLLLRSAIALTAGAFVLAGCSSQQSGTASPAGTASGGPSSPPASASGAPGGSTASLDPCTLVSGSDLSTYGTFDGPAKQDVGAGARDCQLVRQRANASDDTLTVDITVRDNAGLDALPDNGGGKKPGTMTSGRKAVQAPQPPEGCVLALAVGTGSRVDVSIVSADSAKACDIASKVADVVEPKLPKA
ncbi:DUF3558 family protein [Amycolatopsis sp. NPDC058986]|uniref:DUF3558 family protein n=1 Tax=unclassified Amycolatopsis TaxID=2618356 RepID=UPI00366D8CB8